MKRRLLLLGLVFFTFVGACSEQPRVFRKAGPQPLVIYGTTDKANFLPIIDQFKILNPLVDVTYTELDALPLHERFLNEVETKKVTADLLLSTAMDLQVQLVNDGHAATHNSPKGDALPSWARWRNQAFGFSFEPAVMVYNSRLMQGRTIPQSRSELLADLRRDPRFWQGKVGTYDVERSNVGYLLGTQDARHNSEALALLEAFGNVGLKTTENTATLLTRIERGDLALGYNLVGSYAQARVRAGLPLLIIYPQDYTLAVSRTAIIPKQARHPKEAHLFLEFLLSQSQSDPLRSQVLSQAVRPEISKDGTAKKTISSVGIIRPIALGPGLLVYRDQQKRRRFLKSWSAAIPPTNDKDK